MDDAVSSMRAFILFLRDDGTCKRSALSEVTPPG